MISIIETLNPHEIALAREKAQVLVEIARSDSTFRQKVVADPISMLKTFGFSVNATATSWAEKDEFPDALRCVDGTCWVSACPGTCYITIPGTQQMQQESRE